MYKQGSLKSIGVRHPPRPSCTHVQIFFLDLSAIPEAVQPVRQTSQTEPSGRLGPVWCDLARSRSDLTSDGFHTFVHTSCSHLSGCPGWLFQRVERATEMSEPPGIIPIRPGERTGCGLRRNKRYPTHHGTMVGGASRARVHTSPSRPDHYKGSLS